MTNLFLLSCAIADTVDDYLLGDRYDFSKVKAVLPFVGPAVLGIEKLLAVSRKIRSRGHHHLHKWRLNWQAALHEFLIVLVSSGRPDRNALSQSSARLRSLVLNKFPGDLLERRARIPAAFRSQDLTHFDILTLASRFVTRFPERKRPVLVVGLRTAGSYFAPLLHAYLKVQGYQYLDYVTMRPKKGLASWERTCLERMAKEGGLVVLVDEPPNTGSTLARGVDILRRAGFATGNVVVLLPVHPTRRDWRNRDEFLPLSETCILTLDPEEWHKHKLFQSKAVETRLREYFQAHHYSTALLDEGPAAEQLNTLLQGLSEQKFHSRLMRIYQVHVQDQNKRAETRYVLAKSVGWGWLGYHAFIAAQRLSQFVPPVLGLRDGILYTEWLPQGNPVAPADQDRGQLAVSAASYIGARVRSLGLGEDPARELVRGGLHNGFQQLANVLSGAYGSKPAALLKRGRIRHELSRHASPFPTLIDGRMRRMEWIRGPSSFLKTDFEHHGLGKTELNVTDPAYDLAEAILSLGLSEIEENKLIGHYVEHSGDANVHGRIFMNKLLAGTWAMTTALDNLNDAALSYRHHDFNQQYLNAWDFLTLHAMRYCATFCLNPKAVSWHSPLVVLDIDGVLDKQIFGFPSTTAAGIQALSCLHAHDFAVAVNTARSLSEVREYCTAYGFAGGVAEYGSVIWDAIGGRERVLVSPESLSQLETVRSALRQIPGVFLNGDYQYSIRAYTYTESRTVPLPTTLIRNLLARLKAGRLRFHQTYLDTALLANEIDKGTGLLALLAWIGKADLETIAIGDSEPDLAMFRVAKRCFAPSQISCPQVAALLGCRIADRPYQPGLLSIVRFLVHPNGHRCDRCRSITLSLAKAKGIFPMLLRVADQKPTVLLLRALLDSMALQTFAR
jgi:hydroxymethylpyrimidine pyrophosphatase-like HAD family hydrolase